jgi:hypothetical protein
VRYSVQTVAIRLAAVLVSSLFFFGNVYPEAKPASGGPTHHLGLMAGGGIASYREDLVVPISFDGPSFLLGGQYTVQRTRTCLQLRLHVSVAFLENRFSHKAYALAVDLRPSWTKMLWDGGDVSQIWCGLALPMQMRNLFMDSWDDAHLYWLTTHSLAVVGEYHTRLPRLGYSVIRMELPIIGLVSRPPDYRHQKQEPLNHFTYHFSAPNKAFTFKGIWAYQSPLLQVMIRRSSKGAVMNLGLELGLDHSSVPKDIWGLNTRLLFSYQWRIG